MPKKIILEKTTYPVHVQIYSEDEKIDGATTAPEDELIVHKIAPKDSSIYPTFQSCLRVFRSPEDLMEYKTNG